MSTLSDIRTELRAAAMPQEAWLAAARPAAAREDACLCSVYRLGRVPYREAWNLQRELAERRIQQLIPDCLLLLEHPPVITLGRNARRENLLSSREELQREGIELVESNRGGDVTFHGLGQLVGYPILDLSRIRKDVVWYVRTLEEAIIRALGDLGLAAEHKPGMTGVWAGHSKVAAIGVHISRWVTSHGFALNIDTDLSYYRHIVPCGISAYPVSSLQHLLGRQVTRPAVEESLVGHLGELLGRRMQPTCLEALERGEPCRPPMC